MTMTTTRLRALPSKSLIAASIALAAGSAFAQATSEAELARKLDQLAAELAAVKAQLAQMQQQAPAPAPAPAASGSFGTTTPAAGAAAAPASPPYSASLLGPGTVITSYGEINYNRPTRANQNTQIDLRRFVLGYQHRFDEKTQVVTELEVEHSVTSADDPGEVAVEQAYVEHRVTPTWAVRAGLMLMPVGLINENHDPIAFYGVERNFVETAIIPSTWREGGVQVIGTFDNGLTVQGGITTSFDLTKWDAASPEGKESPLASIHQELALAKGHDLAFIGAVNWRGIPGLLVGGSLFSGQATQAQAVESARITLWDLHARWTPGRWDFSTLYTRGTISNTAALNAPLVGNPTLIPKSFDGYYVQGAYKVWSQDDYALSPFVRWEQFNTAKSYADLGPGLTPEAARAERVVTLGANFQVAQGVVLKADYQRFRESADLNRVNLGLGWSF
jgi:Phosphate-selective porin O and P